MAHGWIGRRYRNLLLDAGFTEVGVEVKAVIFTDYADATPSLRAAADAAVTTGALTRERADTWLEKQERRSQRGRLFVAMPVFLAHGLQSDAAP